MDSQNLEEIFKELTAYVGESIHAIEFLCHTNRLAVCQKFKDQFNEEIDLKSIEKGLIPVSFDQLQKICIVLNRSVEFVLSFAKVMMENDGRPDSDLRAEMLEDITYELWKRQQGGK